jgi:hypothetical protein
MEIGDRFVFLAWNGWILKMVFCGLSGNQSEIFPYNPRTRVISNLEMSSSK